MGVGYPCSIGCTDMDSISAPTVLTLLGSADPCEGRRPSLVGRQAGSTQVAVLLQEGLYGRFTSVVSELVADVMANRGNWACSC